MDGGRWESRIPNVYYPSLSDRTIIITLQIIEHKMSFKFEKLEIWQQSLDYLTVFYRVADKLPNSERYNLKTQMTRAATSVNLNIAEGSTGQTDAEQARFLGLALRSLFETVACLHIIHRLNYLDDPEELRDAYRNAEILARRITAMRKQLVPGETWLRESDVVYSAGRETSTFFDSPVPSSSVYRPSSSDLEESS